MENTRFLIVLVLMLAFFTMRYPLSFTAAEDTTPSTSSGGGSGKGTENNNSDKTAGSFKSVQQAPNRSVDFPMGDVVPLLPGQENVAGENHEPDPAIEPEPATFPVPLDNEETPLPLPAESPTDPTSNGETIIVTVSSTQKSQEVQEEELSQNFITEESEMN